MIANRREARIESPQQLYQRAGFLVRRVNQIANAIWSEECPDPGITKAQYGAMVLLASEVDLDQITLARRLGVDRTTTGVILRALVKRGYVTRIVHQRDTRRRVLNLTTAGRRALTRIAPAARRAQDRLLSPLDPKARTTLLDNLACIADAFNALVSTPVDPG